MQELPVAKVAEPESPVLLVSPAAAEVFLTGLREKGLKAVRMAADVGVDGGVRFRLGMAKEPEQGDLVVVEEGVTFYMDLQTATVARGTLIDYQQTADGGTFLLGRVGGGGCGCGNHGGHGGAEKAGHGGSGGCGCGANHGGSEGHGHGGSGGCGCGGH